MVAGDSFGSLRDRFPRRLLTIDRFRLEDLKSLAGFDVRGRAVMVLPGRVSSERAVQLTWTRIG